MKFLFVVVGFSLAVVVVLVPSIEKIKEVEKKAQISIGSQVIVADISATEKEREKGLAGKRYIGTNEGMLFVFEEKDYHSFWMKGMRVPIDVIWISGDEIIGFEEHVIPDIGKEESELEIYRPPVPVDKFLELRGGRVSLLDAEVGDTINIKRIIPSENNL